MQINKAYEPIYRSKKRYNVLKGGAGSAKSYSVTQIKIVQATERKKTTLFLRKVASTLRNSIFSLINKVLIENDYRKGIDYRANKTEMSFEFSNGSRFILAGVDDVEKLKSIADIDDIVMEEATEFDEADFLQIDMRLRGITLINPSITLMFNPVSNNHWLCKRFDESFDEKTTLFLQTTYRDNAFLDEQYIQMLENLINIDENLYRIYVLNEWGIEDPESLFAKDFKEKIHYTKSRAELYDPHQDVFLCWDFNIQNTCLVVQNPEDNVINVLQEYHIKGYDLEMLANLIKKEYEGHFITINGDAAGHSRSALTSGNATAYDILKGLFGLSWEQFHVPRSNPSHRNSRLLTNLIFKTCEVNIALECVELKNDLIAVKVDDSGSMDPYKKKNPNRSHWMDCFVGETIIETINGPKRIDCIGIGELVLTRNGYREVIDKWDSVAAVYESELGITCTNDHKVYTYNRDFIELNNLHYSDTICILDSWNQKKSNLMDSCIIDTQNQITKHTESIFSVTMDRCIGLFMNSIMARYRKAIRFIIKMAIRSIIISKILNALNRISTYPIISKIGRLLNLSVLFAKIPLTQKKSGLLDSAPIVANQSIEEAIKRISYLTIANYVGVNMGMTNIIQGDSVQKNVQKHHIGKRRVYDITVKDDHEFFANGVLVHNCLRYHFNAHHSNILTLLNK